MYMETTLTNHQEVAEPDQVSGSTVAGLASGIDTGIAEHTRAGNTEKEDRIVIGLGVLDTCRTRPAGETSVPEMAGGSEDKKEGLGDLVFAIYERQERLGDRLDKKIRRLNIRLNRLEGRRTGKIDRRKSASAENRKVPE
jgi:hypothetical protein